jgi:hypothetical protein
MVTMKQSVTRLLDDGIISGEVAERALSNYGG